MPLGVQPGYEGYAALGDILGGGATTRANAKAPIYAGQAADAAFKFNRAAQSRSEAIIKQSMLDHRQGGDAAIDGVYGADNPQAAFAKFILGSAATPDAGNLGKFQTPGYPALVAEQQAASAAGDYKRANAITAVLGDKQFEPVIERGGAYIENGATLGDLDAIPTPTSLATIEQKEAATRQGQQRTDAAVEKSRHPPAPRAHSSAPDEEAAILEQARQRIAQGHPARNVADYLRQKGYPNVAKKIYSGQ